MMSWRERIRAVTMMELVLAMGLLFVAAGGVMTILVAGSGYPRRTQYVVVRDALVKAKLDELLADSTPPTYSGGYNTYYGNPDYEFRVDTEIANFDSDSSWVIVTVKGPKPYETTSSLRGLFVRPNGAALFAAYACNSCHATGTTTPNPSAPNLSMATLTQGMNDRNASGLPGPALTIDEYIRESVRDPLAFEVAGYTVAMDAYPDINAMPEEDLQALTAYIKSF
ncbi:MAG: hypothetical protein KIS61_03305 [Candidatus Eremiobacteraeota bacterium]|nr:hypothetical protein [Candidatus Eremiobacteraeota bacterium]